jgi:hypothetical protein
VVSQRTRPACGVGFRRTSRPISDCHSGPDRSATEGDGDLCPLLSPLERPLQGLPLLEMCFPCGWLQVRTPTSHVATEGKVEDVAEFEQKAEPVDDVLFSILLHRDTKIPSDARAPMDAAPIKLQKSSWPIAIGEPRVASLCG